MQIDAATLRWQDAYKLLIGAVVPRPIAFVSTVSPAGQPNLAPFSFFSGVCANPPCLSVAIMRRPDGTKKDTLRNIEATGEFVVNVVTEAMAVGMNETATEFPPEVNEFTVGGFTPAPAVAVRAPRVAESPISLECRLLQVVELGASAGSGSLVLGQVVYGHVRDDLYREGRIDVEQLRPVGRLAGNGYTTLGRTFELVRKPYQPG